ncbi:MAG: PPC domain-containing protein, partial [Candidatus Promineifilaceae bacterium]
PSAAATPSPRPTASRPPRPTLTPRPDPPLPAGWRLFGSDIFGLHIAAPEGWSDASAAFRNHEAMSRFGPRVLFLADSPDTAATLLSGAGAEQGSYIFAYRGLPRPREATPDVVLRDAISAPSPQGQALNRPTAFSAGEAAGALLDLTFDPLDLFAGLGPGAGYRLLALLEPVSGEPAIFLIGLADPRAEAAAAMLEAMTASAGAPQTHVRVVDHLQIGRQSITSLTQNVTDVWTVNGEPGRYATVSVLPQDAGIDLTLAVLDPAGDVVASTDNGYGGDEEVLTDLALTQAGTYLIQVTEFFNEAGDYQLALLLSNEPQFGGGGRLELGQEVTSELVENGEHVWSFDATAEQEISLVLTPLDDSLDVILQLLAPDDRELALLDEGFAGDAEVLNGLQLPITGAYEIVVRTFGGRQGVYRLALAEGGDDTLNFYDAGDLADGDNKREVLRADEAHAWFFQGRTGDQARIEAVPVTANMDLEIWLLDPNLKEIAMQDEALSDEPEEIISSLPLDGQYLVLVREFFGEPGEYEVSLAISGENEVEIVGAISLDQTVSGSLPAGARQGWTFEGQAGESIRILLDPDEPGSDLVLALLDPAGATAVTVDAALSGQPEELAAFELTASGQWTILVQEFFNEGGDYRLTLARPQS